MYSGMLNSVASDLYLQPCGRKRDVCTPGSIAIIVDATINFIHNLCVGGRFLTRSHNEVSDCPYLPQIGSQAHWLSTVRLAFARIKPIAFVVDAKIRL